jgi:general secretion pathway protein A
LPKGLDITRLEKSTEPQVSAEDESETAVGKRAESALQLTNLLAHYGLKEHPFGVTPDPRYLYTTASHSEAFTALLCGIEAGRGFMTLIAPPGTGKTTLLYRLLERYRTSARTAFLFQTQCDSREFFGYLLADFGIESGGQNLAEMHLRLNELLASEQRAGRRFVLFVDEAHNLSDDVLETLRLISDFERPNAKLMQIVLAGHLSLVGKLASPALLQRISVRTRLRPLAHEEVASYIDHRLQIAGYSADTRGALFTLEAQRLLAVESEGIPRNVNNLCFHALTKGFALSCAVIDDHVIRDVLTDLEENLPVPEEDEFDSPRSRLFQVSPVEKRLAHTVSAAKDALGCTFRPAASTDVQRIQGSAGADHHFTQTQLTANDSFPQSRFPTCLPAPSTPLTVIRASSSWECSSHGSPTGGNHGQPSSITACHGSHNLKGGPVSPATCIFGSRANGLHAGSEEPGNGFQVVPCSTDSMNRHEPACETEGATNRLPEISLQNGEMAQKDIAEAKRQALQAAASEQIEQTRKELESACSIMIAQARIQLENQGSAALEDLSQRASARLHSLEQEHLKDVRTKHQAQMTTEIQKQISEFQTAAENSRVELQALADRIESMLPNGEVLSCLEHACDRAEAACKRADTAANDVARAAEESLNNVQNAGQTLDMKLAEAVDRLQKIAGDLLKSWPAQLQKQADESAEQCLQRLGSSQANLLMEINGKLAATGRSFLDYFAKEADTAAQQFRRQLEQNLKQGVVASIQQIEGKRRPSAEQQAGTIENESHVDGGDQPRSVWKPLWNPVSKSKLKVALTWVAAIAPVFLFVLISIFIFLSVRPERQLRSAPPVAFFEESPEWNAKRRATEERLAMAYWGSAVRQIQQKYQFRTKLPDDPPPEFNAEGVALPSAALKDDSASRARYWRKLRQVWGLPQIWEKSYGWSTDWLDSIRKIL